MTSVPPARAQTWDTFSDTWVATDALGRSLPTHDEVGGPRANKTVGIFYFLWLGAHGRQLFDLSKIMAAHPADPHYGPRGAFHFWSEPRFGYYLSTDEAVIRKHAQMLTDAGVDAWIFDVTNGPTYEDSYRAVGRVLTALKRDGLRTPQFAFITHSHGGKVAQQLYDNLYRQGDFAEHWFRWQGKPLILVKPEELTPPVRAFFTVRESWAWSQPQGWFGNGKDKWPWLDHHPQTPGWHDGPEQPEQISVCVAQHPTSNIGRSFHDGQQPAPDQLRSEQGLCFAEQWRRALQVDPEFVFVTGWNEWVAQRFISDTGRQPFLGQPLPPGGTFFVDLFNPEFSRDIEPMQGGHGDNYYYQLAANVRRYKGVRPLPAVQPRPIQMDGQFDDWREVQPEFRDTLGDPVHRDHPGWMGAGTNVNRTGRNDLLAAKVSWDARHVYFYVRARQSLTAATDPNWMLLFLNSDRNPTNGWLGYDFVVNRTPPGKRMTHLEKQQGHGYQWAAPTEIEYRLNGAELELAIPRTAIGLAAGPATIDFKWADNLQQTGDAADFTLNGDAAPNDRFNFRARMRPYQSGSP